MRERTKFLDALRKKATASALLSLAVALKREGISPQKIAQVMQDIHRDAHSEGLSDEQIDELETALDHITGFVPGGKKYLED